MTRLIPQTRVRDITRLEDTLSLGHHLDWEELAAIPLLVLALPEGLVTLQVKTIEIAVKTKT